MKKLSIAILSFLKTFILLMGAMFVFLLLRGLFTYNNIVDVRAMLRCVAISSVLAFFHLFVFTDYLVEKMPIKIRCLISMLPCLATTGFFVFRFSNYLSLLGLRADGNSREAQIFDFWFSLVVGAVVVLLALYFVEMLYRKIGKHYDKALQEYKQRVDV